MSYEYLKEREFVFTEKGTDMLLKAYDVVRKLLTMSGAFREQELHAQLSGDSWQMLACVDYLVERGDILRVRGGERCPRQHNVYVSNR